MPDEVVNTPAYPDDFAAFTAMREGKTPEAEPAEKPAQDQPAAKEDTPPEPKPAEDTGTEETEDSGDEQEEPDKPKGKGGFQRRIDKLTAKVHDLERQLAVNPAAQPTKEEPATPSTEPVAPRISQYDDLDAYEAARTAYQKTLVKWELAEMKRSDEQSRQKENERKQAETFAERVKEAEKKHADFQDVAFSEDIPYSPAMVRVISELDEGPDVAYFLGKNPAEAERISKLSEVKATYEIGKIAAKITAPPDKPKPSVTKAPKPPAAVDGAAAIVPNVYDEAFASDYARWEAERNRTLRKR